MDEQSGESKEEEVIGVGIGELEIEELVPEWGWRRDKGNWFRERKTNICNDVYVKICNNYAKW